MITFILALFLGFILGRADYGPWPFLLSIDLPYLRILTATESFSSPFWNRIFKVGPIYIGIERYRYFK